MSLTEEERLRWCQDALRNPVLIEAFEGLGKIYLNGIITAEPRDDLGRYRHTVAYNVVSRVHDHLKAYLAAGKLDASQAELAEDKQRRWIPRF